jgi:L-lactate dehydrogenase complex protein LldE
MKVALFVPCYVDQFFPHVAVATMELIQRLGVEVEVPLNQTCCGQPMANSGFEHLTKKTTQLFEKNFSSFDYIVSPSGSCVLHVKEHVMTSDQPEGDSVKIFELSEFLVDVMKIGEVSAAFPHKVGLHESCHGQRGLFLSQMSELNAAQFSKPRTLLEKVQGIELISLSRKDECCGFGGTFSVFEEAVSVKMGRDRIADHLAHGAEYITGTDMSCLMHLDGILKRQKSKTKVIHLAEILNSQL